jgi:hypothetical protein
MAGAMRRFFRVCAPLMIAIPTAWTQTPTEPPSSPPPKRPGWFGGGRGEMHRPEGGGPDAEKFENVRKALEALTPEQRKRFQENFLRWSNLSPEEKKSLADREIFRRKKIAEDIDAALKEAGLDLDNERRELFARRYGEERHKIEEQLHKELEDKRRPLLKEVIARLKAEFSGGPPATGTDAAGRPVRPPDATPQP